MSDQERQRTLEQTLTRLLSALRDPEAHELALVAAAGNGKHKLVYTALAKPGAQALFPDGVVWLEGDHPYPWLLTETLSQRCAGLGTGSVHLGTLEWLRTARALVVVSGGGARPSLGEELRRVARPGGSRLLWLRESATPDNAHVIELPPLTEQEALALFREGSGETELTPGQMALVARCSGQPLALQLLAGLERSVGCERLLAELDTDQPLTPEWLLGHAWRVCSASQQRALLWASHFPQFFRLAPALAAGLDVSDWSTLVGRGWCESAGEGRWRLPLSVRRFLHAPELREAAAASFASWAAFLLQELDRGMTIGFDNIAVDASDLASLWAQHLDVRNHRGWGQHTKLINSWARSTSHLLLSHDWHHSVLANLAADPGPLNATEQRHARAQLLFAMAYCQNHLQQPELANDLAVTGLALVADHPTLRSDGLAMKGVSAFHRNRFPEAVAHFREALQSLPPDDDKPLRSANLLADIAQTRLMLGELDGAESALRQAIALTQRSRRIGSALPNINALGLLLIALERIDEALEVLQDGVQQSRRLRNRDSLPYLLHSLALAQLEARRPIHAYQHATEAYGQLNPRMHNQVAPLLATTLTRTMAQAPGMNLTARDVRKLLSRCWPIGGGVAWYASLAVIDYLAFEAGRPDAAGELVLLLASFPHEGHLNTIIRRTLTRLQPEGTAIRDAVGLPEMWTAIGRVAPELVAS